MRSNLYNPPARAILAIFLATATIFARESLAANPASVAQVTDRMARISHQLGSVFKCPNRVWPGLDRFPFHVLFVSPQNSRFWLWSSIEPRPRLLARVDLTPQQLETPSPYAFSEFRGDRVVIVNLDLISAIEHRVPFLAVDEAVLTAFHESFHWLYQMRAPWAAHYASVPRNPSVDHVRALYTRRMLIRALSLENQTRGGNLGRASFWHNRWKTTNEAPETLFSDVLEGTAYYTEWVAAALIAKGCEVSEQELVATVEAAYRANSTNLEHPAVQRELVQRYLHHGYQTQSYDLGLLSLLALRRSGVIPGEELFPLSRDFLEDLRHASTPAERVRIARSLTEQSARVRSPVEILLEGVQPLADADDPNLLESISRNAAR